MKKIKKVRSLIGATELHRDDFGRLYDQEGNRVVRVVNSTPEPDGSFPFFFLRLPPEMKAAREAVAWTFSQPSGTYKPEMHRNIPNDRPG